MIRRTMSPSQPPPKVATAHPRLRASSAGKIAILFPGQGRQQVGMGKALSDRSQAAKRVFTQADQRLGFSLTQLIFAGPKEELDFTPNTQPAMVATNWAFYQALLETFKERTGGDFLPDFVAGHSVGEYCALLACKSLALGDALSLVRARGQFMEEASPKGEGAMAAALRMTEAEIHTLISQAKQGDILQIGLWNSPEQIVLSGSAAAIERAVQIGGRKIRPLPVSGAFHSPLMAAVESRLRPLLAGIAFHVPRLPYAPNVTGEPILPSEAQVSQVIGNLLVQQVTKPVLWENTIRNLWQNGVRHFVEVGPGDALASMVRQTLKAIPEALEQAIVEACDDGQGDLRQDLQLFQIGA